MRVHRAVNDAEAVSGLQFCVVFTTGDDPLADAGAALADRGYQARPAVLIAVSDAHLIEVALGASATGRLTYEEVDEVLIACDSEIDLRTRVSAIVHTLADRAGPGRVDPNAPHLPDVIEWDA